MSVSYDLFTEAFLGKVTDYDFLRLDAYDRSATIDGYMKRACSQFGKICKHGLLVGDDKAREFDIDIPDDEIDEVVDIISEGMLVQWMKPYVFKQENLINVLNTRDFTTYSPAELLLRIREVYGVVSRTFTNMMREYSYKHGDLSDLHL